MGLGAGGRRREPLAKRMVRRREASCQVKSMPVHAVKASMLDHERLSWMHDAGRASLLHPARLGDAPPRWAARAVSRVPVTAGICQIRAGARNQDEIHGPL